VSNNSRRKVMCLMRKVLSLSRSRTTFLHSASLPLALSFPLPVNAFDVDSLDVLELSIYFVYHSSLYECRKIAFSNKYNVSMFYQTDYVARETDSSTLRCKFEMNPDFIDLKYVARDENDKFTGSLSPITSTFQFASRSTLQLIERG